MATTEERLPQQAIEQMCEVIVLADWLLQRQRGQRSRTATQRLRRHAERANSLICRAWFRADTLGDLPPAA